VKIKPAVPAPPAHIPKVIKWMGDSKDRMSRFPDDARRKGGKELFRIQQGIEPIDAAPMSEVGPGTYEIRISTGD
jgi:phage-related protein